MVKFTLRQLVYIRAIARAGGIAQAARSLNVSQPSVAQALDKFEDTTGLVLFDRHHAKGATPTTQGRSFLASAGALLDQAERVQNEAAALAAHEAGEIRIACFSTIAALCLPALVRAFNERHPVIRVVPVEETLEATPTRVRNGRADACITYDVRQTLEGLERRSLAVVRPAALFPADHRLARARRVTLADLSADSFVLYDAPGSREYFSDLFASAGLAPQVAYASQSIEGVRNAVAAGFGFSIVALRPPSQAIYRSRGISVVPIAGPIPELTIVLAMRAKMATNPLIDKFAGCAHQFFADYLRPAK